MYAASSTHYSFDTADSKNFDYIWHMQGQSWQVQAADGM
jgi:hypothetical protein